MSTRSRKRSLALRSEDEELSSPVKTTDASPLSTAKKRKLNRHGTGSSPSRSSIGRGGRGILGKLGTILGYGKENKSLNIIVGEEEEKDGDGSMEGGGDIWDVEASDAEESRKRRRSGRRSKRAGPEGVVDELALNEDDIWDMKSPGPEDANASAVSKSSSKGTPRSASKSYSKQGGNEEERTPKRRGRPRKGTEKGSPTKSASKPGVEVEQVLSDRSSDHSQKREMLRKAQALSRAAIRQQMVEQGQIEGEEEDAEDITEWYNGADVEDGYQEFSVSTPSARKRGRPRKSTNGTISSSHVLKGILTPGKMSRTLKSKKSVVFEGRNELDLGFRDLPDSAKQPKSKRQVEKDQDLKGSDDVACAICSGLESEEPNEIIFCDDCDLAVHQECYHVPVIPEGDWLCKECSSKILPEMEMDEADRVEISSDLPDIEGFEDHLRNIQRAVMDKLTGRKRIKLRGHDEELQKVYQVVEQTVLAGEGNSMLVIGARGSGKTTLVESVISDLSAEHREKFHLIRLNGLIHTDDKIALKEIWRQLGREMDVEDEKIGRGTNAADTLASLLALLSHPSELSDGRTDQTTKSVIFILDEFDLFTTHPRQALLYNLFDIAQARKAPIVVVGLTTRVDVVESLEKRVKSRFSHRYVHLSLPRNLPAFWEICKDGLITDAKELEAAGFDSDVAGLDQCLSFWQSMIDDLYNKDSAFKHHLQSHFYRTKSVPAFFTTCILPIANLSLKNLPLMGPTFSNTMTLTPPDSKLHILQGLSELELALLIAAARLDIILDTDTCNFGLAYDEYSSLTSRHKIQTSSTGMAALGSSAKIWGRDVALGAWERLVEYELLVPAGIGGGTGRDFGVGGRMWKIDVGLEEITGSVVGMSGVMAKWCREI